MNFRPTLTERERRVQFYEHKRSHKVFFPVCGMEPWPIPNAGTPWSPYHLYCLKREGVELIKHGSYCNLPKEALWCRFAEKYGRTITACDQKFKQFLVVCNEHSLTLQPLPIVEPTAEEIINGDIFVADTFSCLRPYRNYRD